MPAMHTGPLPPGLERREFLEQQPTYWLKRCYQSLRRHVDTDSVAGNEGNFVHDQFRVFSKIDSVSEHNLRGYGKS